MKTITLMERLKKLENDKKDTFNLRYDLMYREWVESYIAVIDYTQLAHRNLQKIVNANITKKYNRGKNSTQQLEKRREEIEAEIACYYEAGQDHKTGCQKLAKDYNKLCNKLAIRAWIEENASAQASEIGFNNLKAIIKAELIDKWN